MKQQPLVGQGLHIIEASRSYSDAPAVKEFHGVWINWHLLKCDIMNYEMENRKGLDEDPKLKGK